MREKEVIVLHKKLYDLISKRWHETIYGVGDYEPIEEPALEILRFTYKRYTSPISGV